MGTKIVKEPLIAEGMLVDVAAGGEDSETAKYYSNPKLG